MRHRIVSLIAAAALMGVAGCGSDDNDADDDQAATATTPAVGQVTTATTPDDTATTPDDTTTAGDAGAQLSPEGRAVLAASQDLAAEVSETAQQFTRGDIEQDEATARLELAGERARDLRERAQQLPAADRAGERLAELNQEISRTAMAVSRNVAEGRAQSREEIEERIAELRDEAQSTVDAVSEQLDEQARKRFRDALDRIGVG